MLDLGMRGMSGFEVLERLKADPRTRRIPIIIFTSTILEPKEQRRLEQDATAIPSKEDASREIIVAAIERALAGAGVPEETHHG